MRSWWMMFALAACAPEEPGGRRPLGETTSEPTTPTVVTTPTSPSSEAGLARVAPSVTLTGVLGAGWGDVVAIVPGAAGAPASLLVGGSEQYSGVAGSLLLDGDLPRGEHALLDVWDGISAFEDSTYGLPAQGWAAPAGDVDDDGEADLWLASRLYLGPLLGRAWTHADATAWVEGYPDVWVGALDVDGDGHEDAILDDRVLHGPLSGELAVDLIDPAEVTLLEGGSGDVWPLPDLLGAGRHAFSVGRLVAELPLARGSTLRWDDGLFDLGYDEKSVPTLVRPVSDLNADGSPELMRCLGESCVVWGGPIDVAEQGWLDGVDGVPAVVSSQMFETVGDLDGDGGAEVLLTAEGADGLLETRLAFSPYDPDALPRQLLLGTRAELAGSMWDREWMVGDLDGDGLDDVVKTRWTGSDADDLFVWYGADLLAAMPAR